MGEEESADIDCSDTEDEDDDEDNNIDDDAITEGEEDKEEADNSEDDEEEEDAADTADCSAAKNFAGSCDSSLSRMPRRRVNICVGNKGLCAPDILGRRRSQCGRARSEPKIASIFSSFR